MLAAAVLLVVVFRLYLTGDRDILALNSPHDEYWYIESAFNRIWRGSYNEMTLIHLPVYSGWLAFLDILGIPARLAIDVSWLVASGYLAYAVGRLTKATWAAFAMFAFLAFHPYVIRIFDRALAETFLTVTTAAVLGAGIELWNRRAETASVAWRVAMVTYCIGFAVAFHTRTEGVVLLVPLLLLACWSLYDRQNWWRRGARSALLIPLVAAPLLSTIVFGGVLSAGNYLKWGIWANQELAAPGYKNAMAALNAIDTGPTPKQITVTREMMSLAFKESPTFRELQPAMDGPTGSQWVAIASPYVAAKGEIGNGWFYWALRDVAARTGWHANAQLAELKYAAVGQELEQAFNAGRLKRRVMLSSFVDPDVAKWLPDLPTSIYNVTRLLVQPKYEYVESPLENAAPQQFDRYTAVTGRRQPSPRVELTGWVVAPPGSLIGLGSPVLPPQWQPLGPRRADVPNALSFAIAVRDNLAPTELILQTPEGQRGSIAISALGVGKTATLSGPALLLGVDALNVPGVKLRADGVLFKLGQLYSGLGYLSCLLAVMAIVASVVRKELTAATALMLLTIAAIGARVVLLAILDASSWSGTQARYVMPAVSFFGCLGLVSLSVLAKWRQKNH